MEWIKCSERLPFNVSDLTDTYRADAVIITDGVYVCEGEFCGGKPHPDRDGWTDWNKYIGTIAPDTITHWMPLPNPPQD